MEKLRGLLVIACVFFLADEKVCSMPTSTFTVDVDEMLFNLTLEACRNLGLHVSTLTDEFREHRFNGVNVTFCDMSVNHEETWQLFYFLADSLSNPCNFTSLRNSSSTLEKMLLEHVQILKSFSRALELVEDDQRRSNFQGSGEFEGKFDRLIHHTNIVYGYIESIMDYLGYDLHDNTTQGDVFFQNTENEALQNVRGVFILEALSRYIDKLLPDLQSIRTL